MEANELHTTTVHPLLETIANDPDVVNRPAAVPAPEVTSPVEPVVPPVFNTHPDHGLPAPTFDLLHPASLGGVAAASPVMTEPAPEVAQQKSLGHRPALLALILLLVIGGGGGAYALYSMSQSKKGVNSGKAVVAAPLATITVTPSPVATPAPTPVPPVHSPQSVTAPSVAPTVEHPQAVTVRSRSGLWLRSSPDSSNQKNVIGWMAYNAVVSVDSTSPFWWHGNYSGKTGYFAVSYTTN
jgi:hypothetical protein